MCRCTMPAAQDEPAPAYESHAVAEHADNQDAEAVAAEPVAEPVAEHVAEYSPSTPRSRGRNAE